MTIVVLPFDCDRGVTRSAQFLFKKKEKKLLSAMQERRRYDRAARRQHHRMPVKVQSAIRALRAPAPANEKDLGDVPVLAYQES